MRTIWRRRRAPSCFWKRMKVLEGSRRRRFFLEGREVTQEKSGGRNPESRASFSRRVPG
jgi:hypothetical protein